jgi:hypothetical protein
MKKRVVTITIDLKENTPHSTAEELAESVLAGLAEFDEQYCTNGDLRRFAADYRYEVSENE